MFSFASLSDLQDYHNLRAAAFNSQARELTHKNVDRTKSRGKCFIFYLTWGRVSAPTGCSPRDSGRLLSSRLGSSLMISHRCFRSHVDLLSILQDYHNLRAAAFNSQARELTQKTADLTKSRSKCFIFYLTWGRVSAPTVCSPPDSGRLLSSRVGSFLTTSLLLLFSSLPYL